MQNTTPFRELWLKFSEEELLPEADSLLRDAPDVVRNSVTTLHIYNGQNLICQGDPAQAVYIILDGEFIVNKQAENGKQVGLTFCYRGEFLGEMEAICRQAYRYDVIALADCRVLRMPAATFLSWLSQDHRLSLLLNRQLAKRCLINGEQRLMNAVDSIENNLLYMLTQISGHQIHLPRDMLASILGTSRRHTDKVLLRLKTQGKITLSEGVIGLVKPD